MDVTTYIKSKNYTDNRVEELTGLNLGNINTEINSIKIDIEAIKTEQNGAIVFNTLTDLQVAYPNGTSQPAWVREDSAWYFWEGVIADTTPPNNVTNLQAINVAATSLTLTWTASNSNDVANYEIYRDSTLLETVTETNYNVTGLTTSTSYQFTVKAKDGFGNLSSGVTITQSTTGQSSDTTSPNNVTNLVKSNITSSGVSLSWEASSSSDVSGYDIYNGSTYIVTVTGTNYNVIGLTPSTNYTFWIKARDVAGNVSSGASVQVTTDALADTYPPTVTANPSGGTYSTSKSVALTADETASIYYTLDGSTPTTSSNVYSTPLTISTNTTLKYFAKDSAGNSSVIQTQTYIIDPTIFLDTFDRTNSSSSAGSDWTVGTIGGSAATWGINNNQLYTSAIASGADSVLVTDKGLSDKGYIQVDIPVVVTGKSRVVWRYQDVNNHFLLQSNGTGIDVLKRKAGSWMDVASVITNASIALANGATVKIQLNGNVHQIYIGGTLVVTVTDSDFQTATKHGVGNADNGITTRFDNFKIISTN